MEHNFEERYQKLNDRQKEAVDAIDGAVLVVAGPGTGKTELLSLRVANILKQTDTLASSILCLTYTDSAAKNMRERLARLIGKEAYKVAIHTFHSFGSEIINQNPEYFFFAAGYQPSDDLAQYKIRKELFEKMKWDNPLNSFHEDHDFSFLTDVKDCISALKKGGLTPKKFGEILESNTRFLEFFNPFLQELFSEKITATRTEKLPEIIENITKYLNSSQKEELQDTFPSLAEIVVRELKQVWGEILEIPEKSKKTKPLTQWKEIFVVKDNLNKVVFKDTQKLKKYLALIALYKDYQTKLHSLGLYDFEDMLLEVVAIFENGLKIKNEINFELKYNYQEKYQYILVDEFQDTNGVQMRLLESLAQPSSNEGNPNILVVGDDDQAIFKFQGANLQNILKFREIYPKAKTISLVDNYRSSQEILDFAGLIIQESSQRLTDFGIEKKLVANI